jgi:hypothetical protein
MHHKEKDLPINLLIIKIAIGTFNYWHNGRISLADQIYYRVHPVGIISPMVGMWASFAKHYIN